MEMAKVKTGAPLRISLVGGGTDYPWFFTEYGGCVVSFAIDKYVYSDRPARCLSGLGASSAKTVAEMASQKWSAKNNGYSPRDLAMDAILKAARDHGQDTSGWQDPVISAYGGFLAIRFHKTLSFDTTPVNQSLANYLLLFSLGMPGVSTSDMAVTLKQDNRETAPILRDILAQAKSFRNEILNRPMSAARLGGCLDEYWGLKKRLAASVSNPRIDAIYQRALKAGAAGGKVCGSGGGGHILICCEPEARDAVIAELSECKHVPFKIDYEGVRRIV